MRSYFDCEFTPSANTKHENEKATRQLGGLFFKGE
jgi:hypothetical protein